VYYNHKPTSRGFDKDSGTFDRAGRSYVFGSPEPLYMFGHGLSYTKFVYSTPMVSPKKANPQSPIRVSVEVKNAGKRAGEEVVQLYLHDVLASVTRPVKELKGFKRILLKPGQKKQVEFILKPDDLSFTGRDMKRIIEPGVFEVMVGGNSVDLKKSTFEIVGAGAPVSAAKKGGKKLSVEEMGWH
jgi:beta-glucosidase